MRICCIWIFFFLVGCQYKEQVGLQSIPGGLPYCNEVQVLVNSGYIAGYDKKRRVSRWVVFRLNGVVAYPRKSRIQSDIRISNSAKHNDFTNTNYDRGHLAPSSSIGSFCGKQAQDETYLVTNIAMQSPSLNRGLWRSLEKKIGGTSNCYANKFSTVWVIVGTIFSETSKQKNNISIPEAFYKIVLIKKENKLDALAFIFPNKELENKNLSSYLVSINEIERRAKIDFFSRLTLTEESNLEKTRACKLW